MAQVYSKLEIDVNERVTNIITAVQKDSGSRFLDVVLLDGSSPIDLTGHEVRIYGKKYDGKEFYNNGEITDALHGRCQFELTAQALAVANHLELQIVLFKDNVEILSTQAFKILVVKSLLSDNAIESSNEYGALVVLFQNLYEAYDLMVDMVKNMGNAGEIATGRDADTFWKMLEYMAKYMDNDLTQLLENAFKNSSVQGVLDRIGTVTDAATAGTIFAKLNTIFAESQKKFVRHEIPIVIDTLGKYTYAIEGNGKFYGIFIQSRGGGNPQLTIDTDGTARTNRTFGSNIVYYIGMAGAGSVINMAAQYEAASVNTQYFAPYEFGENLTIEIDVTDVTSNVIFCIYYGLYE